MNEYIFNKTERAINISSDIIKKDINSFLKEMYVYSELDYSKFFKMDNLCKLGLIATELIYKKNIELFKKSNKIGIILQNRSSSLDTDLEHQKRIKDNAISPAVFVYTLPNILIGEISIKYKWKSEGVFFVDKEIDFELLSQYSNILLKEERTHLNIIGWVDVLNNNYNVKLCVTDSFLDRSKLNDIL
tara:strand:- start:79 stop:642 length:564 start_codon:yes stop_codon:yes gene_type:complete